VAEHIGSEHHEVEFRTGQLREYLPAVVRAQEEPVVASPAPLLYRVSELASRQVKVVLTGEGSDELFAGYPWFKGSWVYQLRRVVPRPLAAILARHIGGNRVNRLFRIAGTRDLATADGEWLRLESAARLAGLLREDLPLLQGLHETVLRAPSQVLDTCRDPLQRQLSRDFTLRLPDALLLTADKVSMAHSLETRMPFLDRGVVDFALGLPSNLKLRGREEKYLLRRLAHHLPPRIAERRKQGLSIPVRGLSGKDNKGFVEDVLLSGAGSNALFKRPRMERWLAEGNMQRGGPRAPLWLLLNLKLWWDEFIERG
jgi:asparagine synthase (glutamine-hydrolysing)